MFMLIFYFRLGSKTIIAETCISQVICKYFILQTDKEALFPLHNNVQHIFAFYDAIQLRRGHSTYMFTKQSNSQYIICVLN